MKVLSGTVVAGKVELPAESVTEGEHVMVLVPEPAESARLTAEEENDLLLAMEEIRRGEYVDGADLLKEVRARSRA
jgi:hypothetical protein